MSAHGTNRNNRVLETMTGVGRKADVASGVNSIRKRPQSSSPHPLG